MRNGELLLEVAKNLHLLADSLIAAVPTAVKETAAAPAPVPDSGSPDTTLMPGPIRVFSKEEARDILIAIRAKGFNDQIREILTRHGYEKFTAVPPEEYPAIIAEAEALVDGSE